MKLEPWAGPLIGPDFSPYPNLGLAEEIVRQAAEDYCESLRTFIKAMKLGVRADIDTRVMYRDCESFFLGSDGYKLIEILMPETDKQKIIDGLKKQVSDEYPDIDIEEAIRVADPTNISHKFYDPGVSTRVYKPIFKSRRFTTEQAQEIKRKYDDGALQKDLAAEYGCSTATIFGIVHGEHYKEIE